MLRGLNSSKLLWALALALGSLLVARSSRGTGAAEEDANGPLQLLIEAPAGVLDLERTRLAVEHEVRTPVVDYAVPGARGVLRIRVNGHGDFVVVFERPGHARLVRTITPPADPTRSSEVVALLAGNLVRSEAEQLLDALRARHQPKTANTPDSPPAGTATADSPVGSALPGTAARDAHAAGASAAGSRPDASATYPPARRPAADSATGPPAASADSRVEEAVRPIDIALFHPASMPHSERHRYRTHLGLIYGRIGGLSGAGLSLMVTRVDGPFTGAWISGLAGYSGGAGHGLQVSGVANVGRGAFAGFQLSGIANLYVGSGRAEDGSRGHWDGVQIAGLHNQTAHRVRGMQLAGATSINAGSVRGAQVAGIASFAREQVTGLQLSGISNLTAGDVSGLQLSLVNVGTGKVKGAQIGLVNYAGDLEGVSLGLVPYSKTGSVQLQLWSSYTQVSNIGAKFTNGPMYTLLHFGYQPERPEHRVSGGVYLGGHVPIRRFWLDVDVGYDADTILGENISDREDVLRYRAALGLRAASRVGIFGGAGLWQRLPTEGNRLQHRPELFAGVQFF